MTSVTTAVSVNSAWSTSASDAVGDVPTVLTSSARNAAKNARIAPLMSFAPTAVSAATVWEETETSVTPVPSAKTAWIMSAPDVVWAAQTVRRSALSVVSIARNAQTVSCVPTVAIV